MNGFRSARDKAGGQPKSVPLMPGKQPSGANEAKGLGSVAVNRETVRSADHRAEQRHQLSSEHATLTIGRKQHQVELINLSGGGAMIRTDVALAMWQKVDLGFGECTPLECAVRWIRGDRIGLEFAPETQFGGDCGTRNAMLLDALKRSFPESSVAPVTPLEPAGRVDSPTGEQRRAEIRHPLIWWGEIHCNHHTTRVRLRNISTGGALVESNIAYASDAEVVLDLGAAGQHLATVTWSRGDQVGLRFTSPFDIALLATIKPEVATPQVARPAGLKSSHETVADSAGGWQSSTLSDLRAELEGVLKR